MPESLEITAAARAADGKTMTLTELERFIEKARAVGMTGEATLKATLTIRGTIKAIQARD